MGSTNSTLPIGTSPSQGSQKMVSEYKNDIVERTVDLGDPTSRILVADLISDPSTSLGALRAELISVPAGSRTIPVAHSHSDVFAYGVAGSGLCWYHGKTYDFAANDCLGFKAGEGFGFSFLNQGATQEPFDVLLFSVARSDDTLFYPLSPEKVSIHAPEGTSSRPSQCAKLCLVDLEESSRENSRRAQWKRNPQCVIGP